MKYDTNTRIPNRPLGRAWRLAVLLSVVAALTFAARSEANQVYKHCGQKWLKQAKKLQPEELAWMLEKRTAQVVKDLDGDGANDTVTMTNTPSFRNCEVRSSWSRKETTIRIEYGNGKVGVFYWIDGQLTETVKLYPALGRLLLSGSDAGGRAISRWVEYRSGEAPTPESMIAGTAPGETRTEEAALQLASLH